MAATKFDILTFEELRTVLENAEIGQISYRIEKRGRSYVLPPEMLHLVVGSGNLVKTCVDLEGNLKVTENGWLVTESGDLVNTDYTFTCPAGVHVVYSQLYQYVCDANVADRLTTLTLAPAARIVTTQVAVWTIAGPSLQASQKGVMLCRRDKGLYKNDNAALSEADQYKYPIEMNEGDTITFVTANKQITDHMSVSTFHKRVG